MYSLSRDIKYDIPAIFSELIGKLSIITVNISFKNVSHNSQYTFVTVTWTYLHVTLNDCSIIC